MKSAWYNTKWGALILHIAAWALLFSLPSLLNSSHNNDSAQQELKENDSLRTIFVWIMNSTWILFFYLNAMVLIPRFVYKNRYGIYVAIQAFLLLVLLVLSALLFGLLKDPEHFVFSRHILINFFIYLFILSCSTAYQMVKDKLKADRRQAQKENENLKTELSLLRSQASPHFMFNVLNNMVALARKKSDLLEPSLIKFSSLMRYMLYESDEEKVSLDTEIDYLHSYIDLQLQRFGDRVNLSKNFNSIDASYFIEPMLLIPFVENAFKHGTGMIDDAIIYIEMKVEQNQLSFMVKNKYNPSVTDEKDGTSGIGLANVKRRLNLLYGNKHSLDISTSDNWFIVSLQINIA